MQSTTFGQRLELALHQEGITQADLGRAIGISRSAINQIVASTSKGFKPAHLILACRRLRIRPEWLALGEEPMRPDPILHDYYALSPAKRETIVHVIRDMRGSYV